MIFLIALIIILPTLMAALFFTVAHFSYNAPQLLSAETSPVIAICCIIAGIVALIPIIIALFLTAYNLISNKKAKKEKTNSDKKEEN